jgi:monofunctional glycosyltransferase
MNSTAVHIFLRLIGLVVLSFFSLQLFFLVKIALMLVIAPESTSFQRSEAWRITVKQGELPWRQSWVDYDNLSMHIKQAVIASEDDDFINHDGVEWDAIESAWTKNSKALEQQERAELRHKKTQAKRPNVHKVVKAAKIIGGSTISQQLAKNLFLSGERDFVRKGQEFVITQFLETMLSKRQILEIYLNNVEWGEGVFGIEAAAQHYFRKSAKQLTSYESARLAVMLPRPKYFEKLSGSTYLSNRASAIVARMSDAEAP